VASCFRAESASKKAPHELDALFELGVALLQVFDVFSHFFFAFVVLESEISQNPHPSKTEECGTRKINSQPRRG
jgi:hypothetical protein